MFQHDIGVRRSFSRGAMPVSTATVRIPAARPASRSCRLSPTIAASFAAKTGLFEEGAHLAGFGLAAPAAVKTRDEMKVGVDMGALQMGAGGDFGVVGGKAQMQAHVEKRWNSGTSGTASIMSLSVAIRFIRSSSAAGSVAGRCGKIRSRISAVVCAMTGLSGAKSPVARS